MIYYKNSLIIYGGMGSDGMLADDNLYQYSIDTKQWRVVTMSGVKPGKRAFHSMNFFKKDAIIIFGGKTKIDKEGETVSNDMIYIDLLNFNCSTPFIANIGPSPRYGHSSNYNSNFNPEEFIVLGGLDKSFCSFDIFAVNLVSISEDKKWVYENKKLHEIANVNMENRDDIYETANKTIINYKKQIEQLDAHMININKK
jgi:hypothetical protein